MKNKIILLTILGLLPLILPAQLPYDALRFSMTTPGGTARFISAGGAFGALGADFSTLSYNPAGIGLFRSTEFSFSPGIYMPVALSNYNGTQTEDDKNKLNLNNAGMVFAFKTRSAEQKGWQGIQLGFGMNRMAEYTSNVTITGHNPSSTILQEFQNKASGRMPTGLDPFDTKLAWETYLLLDTIRDPQGALQYTSAVPNGGVKQTKYIERRGHQNEMVITLGGNYSDKVYIGGTIGFPNISFREDGSYKEFDDGDTIKVFKSLAINDYLYTYGNGVNFKLGLIARPVDWIRIGGAFHTPTYFKLHDEYSRTVKHTNDDYNVITAHSPKGLYDYSLRTPMRAIVSLGFIINKYGFIGIDYETVDYSDARFETRSDHFTEMNTIIREEYTQSNNIRIGGEANLHPFKIRAGYALSSSPYKHRTDDHAKSSYSFGLGFKDKNYFIDFAWVMTKYNENYYLYDPVLVAPTKIDNTIMSMIMTLGLKL